jgi:predicted RNA polymerase sigma factor
VSTAVPPGRDEAEELPRELAPQVLAALVRRYGQFHLCEDASQEALLAAALQWPSGGLPENPRGWLITVASRRLMDQIRSEQSRRSREERIAVATGGTRAGRTRAAGTSSLGTSPAGQPGYQPGRRDRPPIGTRAG